VLNPFRRSPTVADDEFFELAALFSEDQQQPTARQALLNQGTLDYSLESLKRVDAFLEQLHSKPPEGEEAARAVLRTGAYVGEVIRRSSSHQLHWVTFKEAARCSELAKGLEYSLATAGILWKDPQNMCFPLAKVIKYLENGSEDSVYSFARVILENDLGLR
jgi:hypothetical protein